MHLGVIVATRDPDRVWNAFRLATTALEAGHTVETFLLGAGVEAPDGEHETVNPHGMMIKYRRNGGELLACGSCLDERSIEPDELRPRASMDDCLAIVETADEVLTF